MIERGVAFTNIFNFRDLGGYATEDGRRVRWQRVYRSDDLSNLVDADAQRFADLGIHTVVDLRRPDELEDKGRIPELPGFTYRHIQLVHPMWPDQAFADTPERAEYIRQRYNEFMESGAEGIGETLRLIADPQSLPLVFHCRAGKDRTGIIAAITLALLGVPDDDIADDYQLSERAEALAWDNLVKENPRREGKRWTHITVNPREGMLLVLADIRDQFGSVTKYAESVGVTAEHIATMRAHLLE